MTPRDDEMERSCIYLVKGEEGDYCLKLKAEGSCAKSCHRKLEGRCAYMSEVEEKKINKECLHCTRVHDKQEDSTFQPHFYCTLFEQEPLCEVCEFTNVIHDFGNKLSQLEEGGKNVE